MHGDRVHVQNVGLNSNTRRGSECMETEFMDINLHNLSEIYYLIFLVTTFHCRYCKYCGISFKSKEELWVKSSWMSVFCAAAEGFKLKIIFSY